VEEGVDEEVGHAVQMSNDLLVAALLVGSDRGEFEAVEGTLAGQRLALVGSLEAVGSGGIGLTGEDSEQGVSAEAVVVVEILVSEAEAVDALFDELQEGVFDAVGIAVVGETVGEGIQEVELLLDFTQKQPASVGGDGTAVKGGENRTGTEGLEIEARGSTLC